MRWMLLLLVGCGTPYATFSDFCDPFAEAQCKKYLACPLAPQPPAFSCKPTVSGTVCYCFDNSIQAHQETYHREAVTACLDALAKESCTDAAKDAPPAVCSLVYGLPAGEKPHCPLVLGPLDAGTD